MYSEEFPERTDEWIVAKAAQADFPIYAIDDQTAMWVTDSELEIISEGNWCHIA